MKTLLAVLGAAALLTAANPAFAAHCAKGKLHPRVATYKAATPVATPATPAKVEGQGAAPAPTEQTGTVSFSTGNEGNSST